jgi:Tfp pilus assembly protein PilO
MTLRPRDRIALGVVVLFAAIGAFYMLVLKPEQKKASSLVSQIAKQRQALSTAEANYATGKAARLALKADGPEWAALQRAVPAKSDIPALLRTLERNADAVNVKMTAIQLSGSGSTGAPPAAPSSSAAGAISVPLSLSFAGGYTALDKLVRRLDGLVVVSGKSIRSTGPLLSISNVSLSGSPKLTVQLTATIYQLDGSTSSTSTTTGGQS